MVVCCRGELDGVCFHRKEKKKGGAHPLSAGAVLHLTASRADSTAVSERRSWIERRGCWSANGAGGDAAARGGDGSTRGLLPVGRGSNGRGVPHGEDSLLLPVLLPVLLLLPLRNLGSVATNGSGAAGAGCNAADMVTAGTELVSRTGGVSTAADAGAGMELGTGAGAVTGVDADAREDTDADAARCAAAREDVATMAA